MALSGGHSASVAEDEAAVLSGGRRVKAIPASSLQASPQPQKQPKEQQRYQEASASSGRAAAATIGRLSPGPLRSGARVVVGFLSRAARGLLPPQVLLRVLPGGRQRRARRQAEARAAEVEQVVMGAPARGWPRDDVPGLYSSLSWLVSRMVSGAVAAMLVAPAGPLVAAVAKVTSGFAGGRLGYRFGRRLDRVEVAHVQQYLQDVRDAAMAGMPPEACVEYAAMCDAGPFSPEDDICRWRPLWAGSNHRAVDSGRTIVSRWWRRRPRLPQSK